MLMIMLKKLPEIILPEILKVPNCTLYMTYLFYHDKFITRIKILFDLFLSC